jgi:quercetin dioxygenase-like cupin family protein
MALLAGVAMPAAAAQDGHSRFVSDEIVWTDGPASLPPGSQMAVLEGDPAEAGPITLRLRFPPGYQVSLHTHPAIEHVTVLEGTFGLGAGDDIDTAGGDELGVGGYVIVPMGHPHHAWTSEGTVIQLHSVGPWGITYLDPRDDPRSK